MVNWAKFLPINQGSMDFMIWWVAWRHLAQNLITRHSTCTIGAETPSAALPWLACAASVGRLPARRRAPRTL